MNTKKIAIVSIKEVAGEIYANQLRQFVDGLIDIVIYPLEKNDSNRIEEDVVVLSTTLYYESVKKRCQPYALIITPKLTLTKKSIEMLSSIPVNSDVYLFNLSAEIAIDTITSIQRIAKLQLNFIPLYPGVKMQEHVKYLVTPGEADLLPKCDKSILDIGMRIMDLSTLLDVLTKTGHAQSIHVANIQKYFENIASENMGLDKFIEDSSVLSGQIKILLHALDDVVVMTNKKGVIYFHCDKIRTIFGDASDWMIGSSMKDWIPNFEFESLYDGEVAGHEAIVKIRNIDVVMVIRKIVEYDQIYYIHKLRPFSVTEKEQTRLRAKVYKLGHTSQYSFFDIKGISSSIKNTIEIAKKMSNSMASVLIQGETGTGKEIFAQAIHQASSRSSGAFVAVNCGLFHENLFESELFGYEEGAFTGAKKGGKQGLFEIAHQGTLFLDEIGEMDLTLQAKLLRVIQDKKIRRVGSDRMIDIDVRLIAATNKDLKEQMRLGLFRKDLYYRLNVLPLMIQPLKDRKDDILVLVEAMKTTLDADFELDEISKACFLSHSWDGNVRELGNVVEYLNHLGLKRISLKDLPTYMVKDPEVIHDQVAINIDREILKILERALKTHKKMGRKTISDILCAQDIYLSEQEVRHKIETFKAQGWVQTSKGRGGTRITPLGEKQLRK